MEGHEVPIGPEFDLHSFRPEEIPSVVEEYLLAAHGTGLREVRLIHGRGIGVQRAVVQRLLRSHPLVESFHDAPESHLGATVVRLREGAKSEFSETETAGAQRARRRSEK